MSVSGFEISIANLARLIGDELQVNFELRPTSYGLRPDNQRIERLFAVSSARMNCSDDRRFKVSRIWRGLAHDNRVVREPDNLARYRSTGYAYESRLSRGYSRSMPASTCPPIARCTA